MKSSIVMVILALSFSSICFGLPGKKSRRARKTFEKIKTADKTAEVVHKVERIQLEDCHGGKSCQLPESGDGKTCEIFAAHRLTDPAFELLLKSLAENPNFKTIMLHFAQELSSERLIKLFEVISKMQNLKGITTDFWGWNEPQQQGRSRSWLVHLRIYQLISGIESLKFLALTSTANCFVPVLNDKLSMMRWYFDFKGFARRLSHLEIFDVSGIPMFQAGLIQGDLIRLVATEFRKPLLFGIPSQGSKDVTMIFFPKGEDENPRILTRVCQSDRCVDSLVGRSDSKSDI